MLNEKINLMINNSMAIDNIKGTFGMNLFKKCNAMNLTIKNSNIDVNKVNECRTLIKNTTSIFSNFRGNNLLTTSVNLSCELSPSNSLDEVIEIYNKLKGHFFSNEFLVLAAWVIFKSKDRINIEESILNTKKCYDFMKKNHWFLTSSDDISAAAIISTTSSNLEITFNEIEECYETLKSNGFWGGNNLQSLSHILSLNNASPKEKCEKVTLLNNTLKTYGISLKGYSLPILGIAAFVTDDYSGFTQKVIHTRDRLKKEKGFGTFSLSSLVLNMISTALVASSYIDSLTNGAKESLIETTNNAALTMAIAMQVAAASAASGAAAAAASSSN